MSHISSLRTFGSGFKQRSRIIIITTMCKPRSVSRDSLAAAYASASLKYDQSAPFKRNGLKTPANLIVRRRDFIEDALLLLILVRLLTNVAKINYVP